MESNFQKLEVWRKAMIFAETILDFSEKLARFKSLEVQASQLARSINSLINSVRSVILPRATSYEPQAIQEVV
jgi:hypothetical protein